MSTLPLGVPASSATGAPVFRADDVMVMLLMWDGWWTVEEVSGRWGRPGGNRKLGEQMDKLVGWGYLKRKGRGYAVDEMGRVATRAWAKVLGEVLKVWAGEKAAVEFDCAGLLEGRKWEEIDWFRRKLDEVRAV